MRQRRPIQRRPVLPPMWQVGIHQRNEPFVVMPLQQVRQFMHHHVFQALRGLFG